MKHTVEKKFFPEIRDCKGKIEKKWYITYQVADYDSGTLKRKKIYGDINKYHTPGERMAEAERLLNRIFNNDPTVISRKGSKRLEVKEEPKYITSVFFQVNRVLETRRTRIKESTYNTLKSKLGQFILWLHYKKITEIPVGKYSPLDAKEFLAHLINVEKLATTTHNHYLQILKGVFKELVDDQIILLNPFDKIRGFKRSVTPALYFQPLQIAELKREIKLRDAQLWLFVQIMYYCFIRPGELRKLKVGDIMFESNKILIRKEISKNKKQQYVAIPNQLKQVLVEYELDKANPEHYIFTKAGKPGEVHISVNHMKNIHRAILDSLNYSKAHKLYSWKHTGAVMCALNGMPVKDLQLQMRHHSLDQTDQYLKDMGVMDMERLRNNYPTI